MKLFNSIFLICFTTLISYSQNQYPGNGILGKAYNVFGEYASNKSVSRYRLFDFTKMNTTTNEFGHTLPELIFVENISDHIITTVEGSSIKEYTTKLSSSLGLGANAFFFKASFDAQFKNNYNTNSQLFYYTYMDINTKWRVSLDMRNIERIIPYLETQFKRDLDSLEPKKLFELYGTHFIASAYLGGRIDYASVTQYEEESQIESTKLALNAKYKMISGYADDDYNATYDQQETKTTTHLTVIGGNAEYTNSISNPEQYKKWVAGLDQNAVLCGFENNSLIPIWMLTKDEKRKTLLENYFLETLIPQYPLPEIDTEDHILENENLFKNFDVALIGFKIDKDCDYLLTSSDEQGDFKYKITISNGMDEALVYKTEPNMVVKVNSGDFLDIKKLTTVRVPYESNGKITISATLTESDDLADEPLGTQTKSHSFPFYTSDLYNTTIDDQNYYYFNYYYSDDCRARFFYIIAPHEDQTAYDFGNKGWEEFEAGNYDEAQKYNREALKLENTLWYVHYNVALIYLIQKNPKALEKYQFATKYCTDKETIQASLQDIIDYEKKHGSLTNSEQIKILLKSKL